MSSSSFTAPLYDKLAAQRAPAALKLSARNGGLAGFIDTASWSATPLVGWVDEGDQRNEGVSRAGSWNKDGEGWSDENLSQWIF